MQLRDPADAPSAFTVLARHFNFKLKPAQVTPAPISSDGPVAQRLVREPFNL